MTIFIRTSGGGGIVLIVALALIFGHGSGISGVLDAVLIGLVVLVVLAVAAAVIVRRVLPARTPDGPRTVIRAVPEPGELPGQPPALEPPAVRLHADQLAELAEILRRPGRPE